MTLARGQRPVPVWILVIPAILLGVLLGTGWEVEAVVLVAAVLALAAAAASPPVAVVSLVVVRPLVDLLIDVSVVSWSLGEAWALLLLSALCVGLYSMPRTKNEYRADYATFGVFLVAYVMLGSQGGAVLETLASVVRLASWVVLLAFLDRLATDSRYEICQTNRDLLRHAGRAVAWVAAGALLALPVVGRAGIEYYFSTAKASWVAGPHGLASLAVLACAFPLLDLAEKRRVASAAVCLALLCGGVLLSFVRTAWLGLAVVLVWSAVRAVRMRQRGLLLTAVTSAGLLVYVGGLWFGELIGVRLLDLSTSGGVAASAGSGRVVLWAAGLDWLLASPVGAAFGGGVLNSVRISESALGVRVWAHNDFLEMALTGGFALLSLFVAVMWRLIRRAVLAARQEDHAGGWIALPVLVAYVVMSVSNGMVFGQASVVLALVLASVSSAFGMPRAGLSR